MLSVSCSCDTVELLKIDYHMYVWSEILDNTRLATHLDDTSETESAPLDLDLFFPSHTHSQTTKVN